MLANLVHTLQHCDPSAGPTALHRAMLGTWEIIAILAVVVLLFGASKLPQLGKGLGEAIGNFKRAKADGEANALRGNEVDATPRIDAQPVQKLDNAANGQADAVRR